MKKKLYHHWLSIMLILIAIDATAQLNIGGTPYSWDNTLLHKKEIPQISFPIPNNVMLEEEDKQDEINGVPPRFGFLNSVNINLLQDAEKITINQVLNIWQLKIKCPTALSINLLFDSFWLPTGSILYVYSADKKYVIGGFTSLNNKGDLTNVKGFGTGLVYSDEIILEYQEPTTVSHSAIISISGVVHGYRYINIPNRHNKTEDFGNSGSCQVNINCAEGANWQNEKKGVAMILVGGTRWCTGSLINNTTNNGDLLFLTAHHCLASATPARDAVNSPNATDWTFWWNYEAPNCANPSSEPSKIVTNGATVLANTLVNTTGSDFALLRLIESPITAAGADAIYFNGWDRTNSPIAGGVGIHHPKGDIKKIATYNMIPNEDEPLCIQNDISPSSYWLISWQSTTNGTSVMQGGSSGSPLFSINKKIIGQLSSLDLCGEFECNAPLGQRTLYGRNSVSWNGTLNTNRLKDWLDPNNTGAISCDGGYWDGCIADKIVDNPIANFSDVQANNSITASSTINSGANVTMTAGNYILFTEGFNSVNGSNLLAQIKPCSGRVIPPSSKKGEDDIVQENEHLLYSEISVYPNPSSGKFSIDFSINEPSEVKYSIQNLLGQSILSWNKRYIDAGQIIEDINMNEYATGVYLINIEFNNKKYTQKIVVQ